ncbi:hypothetical protein EDB19DRAFT_1917721 [Suillus lakei]|nr:hypothetical protein EDB19DRAFT_1917721 [Suillus lakei]
MPTYCCWYLTVGNAHYIGPVVSNTECPLPPNVYGRFPCTSPPATNMYGVIQPLPPFVYLPAYYTHGPWLPGGLHASLLCSTGTFCHLCPPSAASMTPSSSSLSLCQPSKLPIPNAPLAHSSCPPYSAGAYNHLLHLVLLRLAADSHCTVQYLQSPMSSPNLVLTTCPSSFLMASMWRLILKPTDSPLLSSTNEPMRSVDYNAFWDGAVVGNNSAVGGYNVG